MSRRALPFLAVVAALVLVVALGWLSGPRSTEHAAEEPVSLAPDSAEQGSTPEIATDPGPAARAPVEGEVSAGAAVLEGEVASYRRLALERAESAPYTLAVEVFAPRVPAWKYWNDDDDSDPAPVITPSGAGRVRCLSLQRGRQHELREFVLAQRVPFDTGPVLIGNHLVDVFEPGYSPMSSVSHYRDHQEGEAGSDSVALTGFAGDVVDLDIRLPDGSAPSLAFVVHVRPDTNRVGRLENGHGARDQLREVDCPYDAALWASGDRRMALWAPSNDHLRDLLVVAGPFPTDDHGFEVLSRGTFHSGIVRVDPLPSGPLTVVLEPAAHLMLELAVPEQLALELGPFARGICIDGAEAADVALALAGPDTPVPPRLLGSEAFDEFLVEREGKFALRYARPGRWRFVAGWEGQAPTVTHEVDLAPGTADLVLTLGAPETGGFLPVRFVPPEGWLRPVADRPAPTELVMYRPEPSQQQEIAVVKLVEGDQGERWLRRADVARHLAAADGAPIAFAASGARTPEEARDFVAYLSAPLTVAPQEVVLTALPAARVTVSIDLQSGATRPVDLRAYLLEPDLGDAHYLRGAGRPLFNGHFSQVVDVTEDMAPVALDDAFVPGRWRFELAGQGAFMGESVAVDTRLVPGRNEVALVLVPMYEVRVHAPGLGLGERVRLTAAGATPSSARVERASATLDADRRAVFPHVPAGQYVLTHGASHAPVTVVVPCGEVLYEPRTADAFELRLAPLDDGGQGVFARAGFRTGDVLLDFNGRGIFAQADLDSLLDVIALGEATVRLERDARVLELRLGPMPNPADPWATFDADFVPAWRR